MDNISYGLIGVSRLLIDEDEDNIFQGYSKKEYEELREESVEGASSRLSDAILHNINLIQKIIVKCSEVGIRHYRLPNSFLCINFLDLDFDDLDDKNKIIEGLQKIGTLSRGNSVTLSIVADPLNSLVGSENSTESSIRELEFYGKVFDIMGLGKNVSNPIFITLSPADNFSDMTVYMDEFYDNFKRLDKSTCTRIVVQNSSKGYWNCLNLFKYVHVYIWEQYEKIIPLSFNVRNNLQNPSEMNGDVVPTEVNVGAFAETWNGAIPIFCWTELNESLKQKETLSKPISDFGRFIKWECDVTGKDLAIFELLHPDEEKKITDDDLNRKVSSAYSSAKDNYDSYSSTFNMLYNR